MTELEKRMRNETRALKRELKTAQEGAFELSLTLDAVLCETALLYGRALSDGKTHELIIPVPDVKNCREKYTVNVSKNESGQMVIRICRNTAINEKNS